MPGNMGWNRRASPDAANAYIHLATGDPGRTYMLLESLLSTGGEMNVSDNEAYRAIHYLAKMEGISVRTGCRVALAGALN